MRFSFSVHRLRMNRFPLLVAALCAVTLLGACADRKPRLAGKRIPVLVHENQAIPDASMMNVQVRLPRPVANSAWPQAGGDATHVMGHLALPDNLKQVWDHDIGDGTSDDKALMPAPIVANGTVFAMDTSYVVTAYDAGTGKEKWTRNILPSDQNDDDAVGGGLAFGNGRIYASTGFAQVVALNAADGKEIWRKDIIAPMGAPPAYDKGRVYIVTVDNELVVLDADNGKKLWTYTGSSESAALLGGAAPAIEGGVVLVPFSSGEIYALAQANGRVLWSDNLGPVRRGDLASSIADIRGLPVMDGNKVFVISHGGRMVAIDLISGKRIWDKIFGGVQTPWVAGDYVYVLTVNSELVCINGDDGRIRWVSALQRYKDEVDKTDPIFWYGPVVAGDRLIVTNTKGEALSISPYTGKLIGKIKLPGRMSQAPVVADKSIYFLTDDADLVALR